MKTRIVLLIFAGLWLLPFFANAQGTWTRKADVPGNENFAAASFSIGTKGYIVAGYYGDKDCWEYDPATNIWTQKADFGGAGRFAPIGFSIGTKGYVGWGLYSSFSYANDFWEYNPVTNAWTKKADLGSSGSREGGVGFSIGSKGYMGTGANHNFGYGTRLKDFYEYNPATNVWTKKADFAGDARCSATGFSIGQKGYIGLGMTEATTLKDFWEYNPANNTWTKKADFGGGVRMDAVGFSIGNKGYAGTGFSGIFSNNKIDFWEYSPENNIWTKQADCGTQPRASCAGFSIGNKGYVGIGCLDGGSIQTRDFWEFDANCETGPAGNITGTSLVCAGQNPETYSVPAITNATSYIWSYSGTGATINGTGNSVTINFASNATSGILTVYGTSSCGDGAVSPDFPIEISQGTWTQKADFGGIERTGAASFAIGSKGYFVTGAKYENETYICNKDLWEYNPETNIWSQKADFGGLGRYDAVGFSVGTKGYIGWGLLTPFSYINDFWEYNQSTNTWTQRADLGNDANRESGVAFSIGGKGYMGTGGNHALGYEYRLKDFWEYNPATDVWTKKADFGGVARVGSVGFSIGSKGYIGTGQGSGNTLLWDFWEYNPATNSWQQKADFGGDARCAAVGFSIGTNGYLGTGCIDVYESGSKDFWEYSSTYDTWTQKADFGGLARSGATGFSIGPNGYIGTGWEAGDTFFKDFWQYEGCCNTGAAGPIAGNNSICPGQGAETYSVPLINNATDYVWSYSGTGATIVGNGNIITIEFATNATAGTLTVYGTGSCGDGAVSPAFPINIAVGGWTQKANYAGIPRWDAVSFSIGEKGYIVTGAKYDGGAYTRHKDLWEYDPITNIWSQKADFGGEGRFAGIGFSIGTKGYVGFGLYGSYAYANDFWEYDATTNVWTKKADLGQVGGREGGVGFSIGSKGYIGTGANHYYGERLKDFWEYNPTTDTWTKKADFGGDARCAAVGFAIGTKGYIGTGNNANGTAFKDFWQYNPANNSWTKKADFGGVARISAAAFSIGSRGYIGTGQPYDANYGKLKDFWEYSPESDSWLQKADFGGNERSNATGFSIGTRGYIGCGNINGQEQTNDFWEYETCCFTGAAGEITGPSMVCQGSVSNEFSVPEITDASFYIWSYSGTGATINGTGNTITIDFAPDATSGILTVHGAGSCGEGAVSPEFSIILSPGPADIGYSQGLLPSLGDGLVAYYPFDGNANDASGNGNNGAVIGALPAEDRDGNSNSAFSFDGVDDYIVVPDANSLDFGSNDFSFSFWVKYSSQAGGYDDIAAVYMKSEYNDPKTGTAFILEQPVNGKVRFQTSNSNPLSSVSGSLNQDEWTHFVSLRQNNVLKLYINGQLDATLEVPVDNVTNDKALFFGGHQSDMLAQKLSGLLDDIRIYNRALNTDEISSLFEGSNNVLSVELGDDNIFPVTNTSIYLHNSQQGVSYQLISNGSNYGDPQFGNGNTLEFLISGLTQTTTFSVLATNMTTGCSLILNAELTINVIPFDDEVVIEVPNAFTPNSDYVNDYFEIYTEGIHEAEVWIKDQWGVLIKEFDGLNEKWDGLMESGKEAPSAPYFYVLTAIDNGGGAHERQGVVYLIRDVIDLYPNPASANLKVQTNGRIPGERNVKIRSLNGDLIMESITSSDEFGFDISQLLPGVYFLEITNGTEKSITKFIKQ